PPQVLCIEPAARPGVRGRISHDHTGAVKPEIVLHGGRSALEDILHGAKDFRVAAEHSEHPGQVIAEYSHLSPSGDLEFSNGKPFGNQSVETSPHQIRVAAHETVEPC